MEGRPRQAGVLERRYWRCEVKGLTDADYARFMGQIDRAGEPSTSTSSYTFTVRASRFYRSRLRSTVRSTAAVHRVALSIVEDRHFLWSDLTFTLTGHPQDVGRTLAGITYHLPNLTLSSLEE